MLLFIAAGLMAFAAAINGAISVPHLREDMVEIDVRPTLLGAVMLGLHFSTVAMAACTVIVGGAAIKSLRNILAAEFAIWTIAVTYVAFGIAAFVGSRSHHTLGYVLIGGLLIGACLARGRG
jgi:hypothetical protein